MSTDGGTEPVWARNGRELFFRNGNQMMVVEVTATSAFSASRARVLFVGPFVRRTGRVSYDVAPDGQRFVMLQEGDPTASVTQVNVLINWFDGLQRLVPTN